MSHFRVVSRWIVRRLFAQVAEEIRVAGWRDGFVACREVVQSSRIAASWGDQATPNDGVDLALLSVRSGIDASLLAVDADLARRGISVEPVGDLGVPLSRSLTERFGTKEATGAKGIA